jgi:aminoglycoside 6'-N-acetyltransferase
MCDGKGIGEATLGLVAARRLEPRVALRPIDPADQPTLQAIHEAPEVARWWGRMAEDFPFDEPESTRFAVLVEGAVAGLVQFSEESEPDFRHACVDLFIDPRLHGQGVGTEALVVVVRHLIDNRGHHRITIDPAADNHAAIRSYEKAGFSPVGVMRSAWCDPEGAWRDVLLMELVEAHRVPPAAHS